MTQRVDRESGFGRTERQRERSTDTFLISFWLVEERLVASRRPETQAREVRVRASDRRRRVTTRTEGDTGVTEECSVRGVLEWRHVPEDRSSARLVGKTGKCPRIRLTNNNLTSDYN